MCKNFIRLSIIAIWLLTLPLLSVAHPEMSNLTSPTYQNWIDLVSKPFDTESQKESFQVKAMNTNPKEKTFMVRIKTPKKEGYAWFTQHLNQRLTIQYKWKNEKKTGLIFVATKDQKLDEIIYDSTQKPAKIQREPGINKKFYDECATALK